MSKWLAEETRLRVDFRTAGTSVSVECVLEESAAEITCLRLRDAGFIEIHLDDSWVFDFFAPDALRAPYLDRLGRDHSGLVQETGACLLCHSEGSVLLLLEIVESPLIG